MATETNKLLRLLFSILTLLELADNLDIRPVVLSIVLNGIRKDEEEIWLALAI
jgi:hypothetical protein